MNIVVFGLSITSSWGNGHATLWRGLCAGLGSRGHRVVFFERDVPYYSSSRDAVEFSGCDVRLYSDWREVLPQARRALAECDAAMVTSYCPDAVAASRLALDSAAPLRVFYDLDTPVTLSRLDRGDPPEYLPPEGLSDFDLVLSYTGGEALTQLRDRLGARRAEPLYGSVDPEAHRPAAAVPEFACDLSYLGTYAEDRQAALTELFVEPAKRRPDLRFTIGGAQYPPEFPWASNILFVRHLPPAQHPGFYCSSRMTLNVTRQAMAAMGYCPSGRLFEAACCGVPILSDAWEGLDRFYTPGEEILLCRDAEDVLEALRLPDEALHAVARRARERTLAEHTAAHRAMELENYLSEATYVGNRPGGGQRQQDSAASFL